MKECKKGLIGCLDCESMFCPQMASYFDDCLSHLSSSASAGKVERGIARQCRSALRKMRKAELSLHEELRAQVGDLIDKNDRMVKCHISEFAASEIERLCKQIKDLSMKNDILAKRAAVPEEKKSPGEVIDKIAESMDLARDRIREVEKDFENRFGRSYGGLMDFYEVEDADAVLVIGGSVASTAKEVIDKMRKEGKKVGLTTVRYFRPFPVDEVRWLAKKVNCIGIVDRSYCFGHGGPIAAEVYGALLPTGDRPIVKNFIAGLGGKDITPEVLERLFNKMLVAKESGVDKEIEWVDVKGHSLGVD